MAQIGNPYNRPSYIIEAEKCVKFIQNFKDVATEESKYLNLLQDIVDRKRTQLVIELDDVYDFDDEVGPFLVEAMQSNTRRYLSLFSAAVDSIMETMQPSADAVGSNDVLDVLIQQRLSKQNDQPDGQVDPSKIFPPLLMRRYEITVRPLNKDKPVAVREIKAKDVGSLVKIQGIVTRVTEVKPMLVVATYSCDQCGFETYQEVLSRSFSPLILCASKTCKENGSAGKLFLQSRGSKFIKFQELKLQELSHQVPTGHIPRSLTVHVTGELTRQANPGDVITITGIFLPTPYQGFRAIRQGLLADTFLEATWIDQLKRKYSDHVLTEEIMEKIQALREDSEVYSKLAQSIAPEIYGHDDVKKALVLLLVGGVTKVMYDGMRIRGDLNFCLMGDPGVAKSQLLKYIAKIAPRGIYTTGKGSSGVGLTAAVMRDPITNEMILEGGALVLADNGVCCIDEFDKMDESDRTSIHEVMEQQTVSISKAGITTTLNARTSILAAANPAYGRYNRQKTPLENINLPAALLSRFDLLFLLLDKPNMENDLRLAQHVTFVHMNQQAPALDFPVIEEAVIRGYISQARQVEPVVPEGGLVEFIVQAYVKMRAGEGPDKLEMTYTSPRTLLGILRLSQALARLRFSPRVSRDDVEEAMRLTNMSKSSLFLDEDAERAPDKMSQIYEIVRGLSRETDDIDVSYDDVLDRVTRRGFKQSDLEDCLVNYQDLNIWIVNRDRTRIHFVEMDMDTS